PARNGVSVRRDRAEPGHDRVTVFGRARDQTDGVCTKRIEVQISAVADPLPMPWLRTRAAARLRPTRMIPPDSCRVRLEEEVAGRREGDSTTRVAGVDGLAPAMHRSADGLTRRRRVDACRARSVARGGRAPAGVDLAGQRPIALLGADRQR